MQGPPWGQATIPDPPYMSATSTVTVIPSKTDDRVAWAVREQKDRIRWQEFLLSSGLCAAQERHVVQEGFFRPCPQKSSDRHRKKGDPLPLDPFRGSRCVCHSMLPAH